MAPLYMPRLSRLKYARKRYADLAVSPDVRETFRKRAIDQSLANFPGRSRILEETPICSRCMAARRPLETHHNELNRICTCDPFELYQTFACGQFGARL